MPFSSTSCSIFAFFGSKFSSFPQSKFALTLTNFRAILPFHFIHQSVTLTAAAGEKISSSAESQIIVPSALLQHSLQRKTQFVRRAADGTLLLLKVWTIRAFSRPNATLSLIMPSFCSVLIQFAFQTAFLGKASGHPICLPILSLFDQNNYNEGKCQNGENRGSLVIHKQFKEVQLIKVEK